jgi:enterochelin esterase-like enzyme
MVILAILQSACQAVNPAATPTPLPSSSAKSTPLPTLTLLPVPSLTTSPTVGGTVQASPSSTPCSDTASLTHLQIDSKLIYKPLRFILFQPSACLPPPPGGFPLLIMLHGQASDENQWNSLTLTDSADTLMRSGEIPPFYIAMPFEEYSLKNPDESGFGQALVEELMPWLEASYPLCRERTCHAIGGLSRGAAWAVRVGLTNWQSFSIIGAHSLPPFFGDDRRVWQWAAEIPAGQLPDLYLDIGLDDRYLSAASGFESQLNQLDIPHTWLPRPGKHEAVYWRLYVEEYVRWYASHWTKSPLGEY